MRSSGFCVSAKPCARVVAFEVSVSSHRARVTIARHRDAYKHHHIIHDVETTRGTAVHRVEETDEILSRRVPRSRASARRRVLDAPRGRTPSSRPVPRSASSSVPWASSTARGARRTPWRRCDAIRSVRRALNIATRMLRSRALGDGCECARWSACGDFACASARGVVVRVRRRERDTHARATRVQRSASASPRARGGIVDGTRD